MHLVNTNSPIPMAIRERKVRDHTLFIHIVFVFPSANCLTWVSPRGSQEKGRDLLHHLSLSANELDDILRQVRKDLDKAEFRELKG